MSFSASSSQVRRHYPRELNGGKNEWKALVDHFTEAEKKNISIENNYLNTKIQLQKESLGQQMGEVSEIRSRERNMELAIERDIINRDMEKLEMERRAQQEKKKLLTDKLVSGNDALMEFRGQQKQIERDRNRDIENRMLQNEKESVDLNAVRALERMEKTKRVFEENQRLGRENFAYANKYQTLENNQLRTSNQNGDIFDSMFERPKHWKNFYANFMQQHQLENISKHENNYLQREMMKDHQRMNNVLNGVQERDRYLTTNEEMKNFNQQSTVGNYQQQIVDTYKSIQDRKALERESLKMVMRENGQQRQQEIDAEQRRLEQLAKEKRDQQNKYREILDVQRNEYEEKSRNRNKMTINEKKVNYEDLQEYKNYGLDIYTHSIPGLAPTVNPDMAKRVINLFKK